MHRRGFLSTLLGATGVLALDPERLLWVPGRKLISIPRETSFCFTGLTPRYWDVTPQLYVNVQMAALLKRYQPNVAFTQTTSRIEP